MQVKDRASTLAEAIKNEDGVTGAVNAFHKHFRPKKPENDEKKPENDVAASSWCIRGCFGHH